MFLLTIVLDPHKVRFGQSSAKGILFDGRRRGRKVTRWRAGVKGINLSSMEGENRTFMSISVSFRKSHVEAEESKKRAKEIEEPKGGNMDSSKQYG